MFGARSREKQASHTPAEWFEVLGRSRTRPQNRPASPKLHAGCSPPIGWEGGVEIRHLSPRPAEPLRIVRRYSS
eukprot:3973234-Pleurochrysis_carterae.AAC.2